MMMSNKSMSLDAHWGELPARELHKQEVITPDIIENIWRQVIDDSNATECDYQTDRQSEFIQLSLGEPHILNTINLHHQLRSMENGLMLRGICEIDIDGLQTKKKPANLFNFLSPNHRRNKVKKISTTHHLRSSTVRSLLKHSVMTLVAHIGYENASAIAVDTLTDIAEHFLQKMTMLLKVAAEQENDGFPDAMERVLIEMGVGGVASIHDYYENYILKFNRKMTEEVEVMVEDQKRQSELNSTVRMDLNDAVNKLQFDELDAFGNMYSRDVPTLQLLDPDIGFPPSLDAGFQMLHSLEQDELNGLEVEEDEVHVSDSTNGQHPDRKKKKDC